MIALLHPGGPPHAHEIWRAWNTDALIAGPLLLAAVLYTLGVRRLWRSRAGLGITRVHVIAFALGLVTLAAALVSPLDAMADALFSAHMVQHLLLLVVVPPLLVLGNTAFAVLWALPDRTRRAWTQVWNAQALPRRIVRPLQHPLVAWLLQASALAIWHLPLLYDAAVSHKGIHIVQHASYLGSALLFWSAVLRPGMYSALGAGAIGVFAAAMQGGALGALLTFGQQPWYSAHADTTAAWSLTPLQDQQIAGAIMWVPGGLVYLLALALLMILWLRAAERRVRAREAHHVDAHARAANRDLGLELP